MMQYLTWLAYFVWAPQLLVLVSSYRILSRYWRTLLFCVFWSLLFSVAWDLWAIGSHIWQFPSGSNVGLWFGIPLEEYCFITFVTLLIASLTIVINARWPSLASPHRVRASVNSARFLGSVALICLLVAVALAIYVGSVTDKVTLNFGSLSYLITTFLFAGGAVLIEYLGAARTFQQFSRVISIVVAVGIFVTPFAEGQALQWQLWVYDPTRTLHVYLFGAAIETYVFMALVVVAVSVVALNFMQSEDRNHNPLQHLLTTFQERLSWLARSSATTR